MIKYFHKAENVRKASINKIIKFLLPTNKKKLKKLLSLNYSENVDLTEERTAAEPGDIEIRNKVLEHVYAYNKRHSGIFSIIFMLSMSL